MDNFKQALKYLILSHRITKLFNGEVAKTLFSYKQRVFQCKTKVTNDLIEFQILRNYHQYLLKINGLSELQYKLNTLEFIIDYKRGSEDCQLDNIITQEEKSYNILDYKVDSSDLDEFLIINLYVLLRLNTIRYVHQRLFDPIQLILSKSKYQNSIISKFIAYIVRMVLEDLVTIYLYIRIITSKLVSKIYDYDGEKALIIYEFYTEQIYCSKTIKIFKDLDEKINFELPKIKINLYNIDAKFNTSIEKFNYAIRANYYQSRAFNQGLMLSNEIMDFESDYKSAHSTRSSKDQFVKIISVEQIFFIIAKKSEKQDDNKANLWDFIQEHNTGRKSYTFNGDLMNKKSKNQNDRQKAYKINELEKNKDNIDYTEKSYAGNNHLQEDNTKYSTISDKTKIKTYSMLSSKFPPKIYDSDIINNNKENINDESSQTVPNQVFNPDNTIFKKYSIESNDKYLLGEKLDKNNTKEKDIKEQNSPNLDNMGNSGFYSNHNSDNLPIISRKNKDPMVVRTDRETIENMHSVNQDNAKNNTKEKNIKEKNSPILDNMNNSGMYSNNQSDNLPIMSRTSKDPMFVRTDRETIENMHSVDQDNTTGNDQNRLVIDGNSKSSSPLDRPKNNGQQSKSKLGKLKVSKKYLGSSDKKISTDNLNFNRNTLKTQGNHESATLETSNHFIKKKRQLSDNSQVLNLHKEKPITINVDNYKKEKIIKTESSYDVKQKDSNHSDNEYEFEESISENVEKSVNNEDNSSKSSEKKDECLDSNNENFFNFDESVDNVIKSPRDKSDPNLPRFGGTNRKTNSETHFKLNVRKQESYSFKEISESSHKVEQIDKTGKEEEVI